MYLVCNKIRALSANFYATQSTFYQLLTTQPTSGRSAGKDVGIFSVYELRKENNGQSHRRNYLDAYFIKSLKSGQPVCLRKKRTIFRSGLWLLESILYTCPSIYVFNVHWLTHLYTLVCIGPHTFSSTLLLHKTIKELYHHHHHPHKCNVDVSYKHAR